MGPGSGPRPAYLKTAREQGREPVSLEGATLPDGTPLCACRSVRDDDKEAGAAKRRRFTAARSSSEAAEGRERAETRLRNDAGEAMPQAKRARLEEWLDDLSTSSDEGGDDVSPLARAEGEAAELAAAARPLPSRPVPVAAPVRSCLRRRQEVTERRVRPRLTWGAVTVVAIPRRPGAV